jgi:hypothetical protein
VKGGSGGEAVSETERSSVPKKSVRYANRDKRGGRQGDPKRYHLMPTHAQVSRDKNKGNAHNH